MRTYSKLDIQKRKTELITLPEMIESQEASLLQLRAELAKLNVIKENRSREFIDPCNAKIHAVEARIQVLDLPGKVDRLSENITSEEEILRTLRDDKERLTREIEPLETNLNNLTIALQIIKDKQEMIRLKDVVENQHRNQQAYETKLAKKRTLYHQRKEELEHVNQPIINPGELESHQRHVKELEEQVNSLQNEIESLSLDRSRALTLKDSAETEIADIKKRNETNEAKLKLANFTYAQPYVEYNIERTRRDLNKLVIECDAIQKNIAIHETSLKRLISEKEGKNKTLIQALAEQTCYEHLNKYDAETELLRLKEEINPHNQDQEITLKSIREQTNLIGAAVVMLKQYQATLYDHKTNQFLIDYENNPLALLKALKNRLLTTLEEYKNKHEILECLEVRRCIYEYHSRVEFIVPSEEIEHEDQDQLRARIDILTGYIWSLVNRKYTDKTLSALIRDSFAGHAISESESTASYKIYANCSLAYLRNFTDADIATKEQGDYYQAKTALEQALVPRQQYVNKTEEKLYITCSDLLKMLDNITDAKVYRTRLLVAIHNVLTRYDVQENHDKLAWLMALNTNGARSVLRITSGATAMFLGAAAGLMRTLEESSISKPVAIAGFIFFVGGAGLLYSGLSHGLQSSLTNFKDAAEKAKKDENLIQRFGVFQQPPNHLQSSNNVAPSAPPRY